MLTGLLPAAALEALDAKNASLVASQGALDAAAMSAACVTVMTFVILAQGQEHPRAFPVPAGNTAKITALQAQSSAPSVQ
jgi:hypothetical protein